MIVLSQIQARLAEAIQQSCMTQKELADLLGTTQQTVSRWLKKVNEPDLTTLLEICLHLSISPNEILGYDDITEHDFLAYCQDPKTGEIQKERLLTALHQEDYDDSDETD